MTSPIDQLTTLPLRELVLARTEGCYPETRILNILRYIQPIYRRTERMYYKLDYLTRTLQAADFIVQRHQMTAPPRARLPKEVVAELFLALLFHRSCTMPRAADNSTNVRNLTETHLAQEYIHRVQAIAKLASETDWAAFDPIRRGHTHGVLASLATDATLAEFVLNSERPLTLRFGRLKIDLNMDWAQIRRVYMGYTKHWMDPSNGPIFATKAAQDLFEHDMREFAQDAFNMFEHHQRSPKF